MNSLLMLFYFLLLFGSGQLQTTDYLGTWEPNTFEPVYLPAPGGFRIHPEKYNLIALFSWLKDHPHNNAFLRPGIHPYHFTTNPVDEIDVELFFQALGDVDSMDMNFITTIYLQQVWYDRRLRLEWIKRPEPYLAVHYVDMNWLWKPDTYFENELEALKHDNTRNNVMIRIYKNGTVLYSRKISMTLSCQMLLHRFPFDEQYCGLRLSSFSYTKNEVKYHWHRSLLNNSLEAVRYNQEINLPEYAVMGVTYSECEDTRFNLTYSCLDATLRIARSFSYYIMQVYIPSGLVVVIACLSFWIDPDAVPARITLGLVSVVTIATQRSGLTSTTPRVSYLRAVDVWMAVCLVLAMAAMIEYSVVNTLQRRRKDRAFYQTAASKKEDEISYRSDDSSEISETGGPGPGNKPPPSKPTLWQRLFGKYEDDEANYVDSVSRAIFPFIFLIFNIAYWVYYKLIFTENPSFE